MFKQKKISALIRSMKQHQVQIMFEMRTGVFIIFVLILTWIFKSISCEYKIYQKEKNKKKVHSMVLYISNLSNVCLCIHEDFPYTCMSIHVLHKKIFRREHALLLNDFPFFGKRMITNTNALEWWFFRFYFYSLHSTVYYTPKML